jgi:hypothetical protein
MLRSSKPLAKKLALKPGQRFLLLAAPPGYKELLGPLPEGVVMTTKGEGNADAVQVFATTKKELRDALSKAKATLNPGGMIWLTYPKGTSRIKSDINRDSIRESSLRVGLQTVRSSRSTTTGPRYDARSSDVTDAPQTISRSISD